MLTLTKHPVKVTNVNSRVQNCPVEPEDIGDMNALLGKMPELTITPPEAEKFAEKQQEIADPKPGKGKAKKAPEAPKGGDNVRLAEKERLL